MYSVLDKKQLQYPIKSLILAIFSQQNVPKLKKRLRQYRSNGRETAHSNTAKLLLNLIRDRLPVRDRDFESLGSAILDLPTAIVKFREDVTRRKRDADCRRQRKTTLRIIDTLTVLLMSHWSTHEVEFPLAKRDTKYLVEKLKRESNVCRSLVRDYSCGIIPFLECYEELDHWALHKDDLEKILNAVHAEVPSLKQLFLDVGRIVKPYVDGNRAGTQRFVFEVNSESASTWEEALKAVD